MPKQIIVEDVWKSYQRGRVHAGTIRHSLKNFWTDFHSKKETFFALSDIRFSIEQGDIVGIVGPNGAGKSTLLRLLSRITFPTRGKITIHGTLSSMLEVGTGFHPELTGRENIFMNGAILGMKYPEINRKLESIIDFSELQSFIDTPVKHYSSGMYVRLAFSVAAHLEPDILLIDEVLSVGDQSFRKKCLDKILDVSGHGKTILMVSHQMSYLRKLCRQGIYLQAGHIRQTGTIDDAIETYIQDNASHQHQDIAHRTDRQGNGRSTIVSIGFEQDHQPHPAVLHAGQSISIVTEFRSSQPVLRNVELRLDCFDFLGRQFFVLNSSMTNGYIESCPGDALLRCTIPKLPLNEGRYYIDVSLWSEYQQMDGVLHAIEFEVEKGMFYPTGRLPLASKGMLVDYQWSVESQ